MEEDKKSAELQVANKRLSQEKQEKQVALKQKEALDSFCQKLADGNDVDYDLAIICYGQNDGAEGFSTNYEFIICAIRSKYTDCSIISILEFSQREYTEKMTTIQSICEHYSIPVADTIAAFNNSGKAYDESSEKIKVKLQRFVVNYFDSNAEIQRGVYNVLTIAQAKGLEFEKVVVVKENMTRNEFYVACTRAIQELYVL